MLAWGPYRIWPLVKQAKLVKIILKNKDEDFSELTKDMWHIKKKKQLQKNLPNLGENSPSLHVPIQLDGISTVGRMCVVRWGSLSPWLLVRSLTQKAGNPFIIPSKSKLQALNLWWAQQKAQRLPTWPSTQQ